MRTPRKGNRTSLWGGAGWAPRAVAVISCALALLAAQPSTAQGISLKSRPTVLAAEGSRAERLDSARFLVEENRTLTANRQREEAGSRPVRRLHVLATVEILQRLLAAELKPVQGQFALVSWFEPVCLETVEFPRHLPATNDQSLQRFLLPPPAERAFAIAHCLLSPPVS